MFKRRATELTDALRQEFGDFTVEYNPEKPRRGAFEFTLVKDDGSGEYCFHRETPVN